MPFFISLISVVIYAALGSVLPPKWQSIVFFGSAFVVCIFSWNATKTVSEYVIKEAKSAQIPYAVTVIEEACISRYRQR